MEEALPGYEARCFIAMRYWHPFSLEAARAVKAWGADEVVLLPLYPQYSSTTTGSSLMAWRDAAARVGARGARPAHVCCYATRYRLSCRPRAARINSAVRWLAVAGRPAGVEAARAVFRARVASRSIVGSAATCISTRWRSAPWPRWCEAMGAAEMDHVICYRIPRDPAEMARSEHRGRDRAGRKGWGGGAGGADRLRVGTL